LVTFVVKPVALETGAVNVGVSAGASSAADVTDAVPAWFPDLVVPTVSVELWPGVSPEIVTGSVVALGEPAETEPALVVVDQVKVGS
jgi:hypothetical protein